MSPSIVGRKRTASGVLLEIRAIGDNPDELTVYVRKLLDEADRVNVALSNARKSIEQASAELVRKGPQS